MHVEERGLSGEGTETHTLDVALLPPAHERNPHEVAVIETAVDGQRHLMPPAIAVALAQTPLDCVNTPHLSTRR